MKRSTNRILVTHTGSLPRPAELGEVFRGTRELDDAERAVLVKNSVVDIVRRQAELGVDVLNDGEMGKESYSTYVRERLTGFTGEREAALVMTDMADYPDYLNRWNTLHGEVLGKVLGPPACVADISLADPTAVQTDIDNLRAGLEGIQAEDVFMSAASPGVIGAFFANHHYPDRESYLAAIGEAMRAEYEAIAEAGFILQLDCPDLAMCRHLQFGDLSIDGFREQARLAIEVLNRATANIDPDRMRLHLCWGNYEGPHHHDINLRDIVDVVLSARPNGIVLESANPRHDHEWRVFENVKLPDGKVLMPGVVDSTSNYIEHPELVAERLVRLAELVGPENIMAATDCGFATGALMADVEPAIAWAKFESMAEGARLATERLYR